MHDALAFLLALVLSAAAMPLILRFADRNGLYDEAGGRKIHSGNIPRLGGLGIGGAVIIVMLAMVSIAVVTGYLKNMFDLAPLGIGAVVIYGLGATDDLRGLSARRKFLVQALVATYVVASGFHFKGIGFHADSMDGSLIWLSVILSWMWIVGVTNAVNLIDGLDGLAGSIAVIVALVYSACMAMMGEATASAAAAVVAGAALGFLSKNFPLPKARIFMGDSGSLFLGFCLAVLPMATGRGVGSGSAVGLGAYGFSAGDVRIMGLFPSAVLLAIPLFDTAWAVLRRVLAGVSLSTPDRKHLHHKLFDYGFGPRRVLAYMVGATVIQAGAVIGAYLLPVIPGISLLIFALCTTVFLFFFATRLPSLRI